MITCPAASTPWTWKTDLAMSRPIVVTVCMDSSSEIAGASAAPTSMALTCRVEEPSTASEADIALLRTKRRRGPFREVTFPKLDVLLVRFDDGRRDPTAIDDRWRFCLGPVHPQHRDELTLRGRQPVRFLVLPR